MHNHLPHVWHLLAGVDQVVNRSTLIWARRRHLRAQPDSDRPQASIHRYREWQQWITQQADRHIGLPTHPFEWKYVPLAVQDCPHGCLLMMPSFLQRLRHFYNLSKQPLEAVQDYACMRNMLFDQFTCVTKASFIFLRSIVQVDFMQELCEGYLVCDFTFKLSNTGWAFLAIGLVGKHVVRGLWCSTFLPITLGWINTENKPSIKVALDRACEYLSELQDVFDVTLFGMHMHPNCSSCVEEF